MKLASIINEDPLDFYLKTSLYPGIAPLQRQGKQSRIINLAFRENIYKYPLLSRRVSQDITELKFCSACRKEDISAHDFTWLRRAHHMPGVSVCWKHGIRLGTAALNPKMAYGQLTLPDIPIVEGSNGEKQFAVFAKDFLNTGIDTDHSLLTKISDDASGHRKTNISLTEELHRNGLKADEEHLLRMLCEMFQNVSNIPVRRNEKLFELFFTFLDEYDLLSKYSTTCVKMRKKGEIDSFVTTPWGFLAGWRSPSEDVDDEQQKFVQIVHNVRNGEYEPLETLKSMEKPIQFLHKECGSTFLMKPRALLEFGASCQCRRRSARNINYARKRVEEVGNYKLLSVADDMTLTIKALDCGHVFDVNPNAWYTLQGCRVCMANKPRLGIRKYGSSVNEIDYSPMDAFKMEVKALTGEDYEVIGEYVDSKTPIEILHRKCGKSKKYVPTKFTHGTRCGCDLEIKIPRERHFLKYVRDRSSGEYEIIGKDRSYRYIIKNTQSGEEKAMKKLHIIQEFERPTASPVLPLKVKETYIENPLLTNLGKVESYLANNFNSGDMFDWSQLKISDLSSKQIKNTVKNLSVRNIVAKVPNRPGIYQYIGRNIDKSCFEAKEFDKGFDFRQKIQELVGNEYELIGEYVNRRTPVEMIHRKCGTTFTISPMYFTRGGRCPECKDRKNKSEFEAYVRKKSNGQYNIVDSNKTRYLIRNTITGQEKIMHKNLIIQELERPTPSPLLPVKKM